MAYVQRKITTLHSCPFVESRTLGLPVWRSAGHCGRIVKALIVVEKLKVVKGNIILMKVSPHNEPSKIIMLLMDGAQVYIHELGHYLAMKLLFKDVDPSMVIGPPGTHSGHTNWGGSAIIPTSFGAFFDQNTRRGLVSAAGPAADELQSREHAADSAAAGPGKVQIRVSARPGGFARPRGTSGVAVAYRVL
jgi:hypothetical protein